MTMPLKNLLFKLKVLATPRSSLLLFSTNVIKVKVPEMGESITSGTLSKWLKNENDHVNQDEVVASIETDKVSVDVHSPKEGILSKQLVAVGTDVDVNKDLFEITLESQ